MNKEQTVQVCDATMMSNEQMLITKEKTIATATSDKQ